MATITKIILIFVLIGIIFSGAYYFYYRIIIFPQLLLKGAIKQSVLQEKYVKTIFECEEISNELEKVRCFEDISVVQQDISICDKIVNSDGTMQKIYRERCYISVAAKKKDISICEKMSSQASKEMCYSEVTQDILICGKVKERTYKDRCYARIAIEKKDISICEKITVVQMTKDMCFKDIAVVEKDVSICEKIENSDIKINCLFLITGE